MIHGAVVDNGLLMIWLVLVLLMESQPETAIYAGINHRP